MAFSHTLQIFNARVGEIQISVFVSTTDMFWLRADSWKIENETFLLFGIKINPGQAVFIADHKKTIFVSAHLLHWSLFDRETVFGDLPQCWSKW